MIEAAESRPAAPPDMLSRLKGSNLRDYGIVLVFLVLFVALSLTSVVFLTPRNLVNTLDAWAPTGILACGLTLVTIAGGFDLSVSAIYALVGIIVIYLVEATGSPVLALAVGLAAGGILGLANGVVTTVGRVNTFITTLGSSIIIRGLAVAITGGFIINTKSDAFIEIARGDIFGVKNTVYIFIAVILVCGFLLRWTTFGRYCFAAGGNPEAARLAGVPVRAVKTATFVISGVLAALAGMLVASRAGSAQPTAGTGLEFTAIAAVVVGGNSLFGGQGAIWRTVLGIALLALIRNGFNLLSVDPTYQRMTEGAIIILAVAIDEWSRRRR